MYFNSTFYTVLLFLFSAMCGGYVYYKSKKHGKNANAIIRACLRISLGSYFFLGVWGTSAYGLWLIGIPLEIGAVKHGLMASQWWLGPSCLGFAAITYALLILQG
jgi:hypothetical protein